jgi:hypothetical protein
MGMIFFSGLVSQYGCRGSFTKMNNVYPLSDVSGLQNYATGSITLITKKSDIGLKSELRKG